MKIEEYTFGCFIIDGRRYFDDIKIIDGKVKFWHGREGHDLKREEINDLISASPEYIIIGTGASGALVVSKEIQGFIRAMDIKLIMEKTQVACNKFNELSRQRKKVAAILHGTC